MWFACIKKHIKKQEIKSNVSEEDNSWPPPHATFLPPQVLINPSLITRNCAVHKNDLCTGIAWGSGEFSLPPTPIPNPPPPSAALVVQPNKWSIHNRWNIIGWKVAGLISFHNMFFFFYWKSYLLYPSLYLRASASAGRPVTHPNFLIGQKDIAQTKIWN